MVIFIVSTRGGGFDSAWFKEEDAEKRATELERDRGMQGHLEPRPAVKQVVVK
jgi:hypothetical protein